ncbi:MAG TPA: RAMP superfamily CRISPR-associated protein [Bacteroidia bacterium]|nr:RAMP superfamily CRISPR-associated protein [Bacteroidia bacterium]HRS58452.1 RAMP superfamily CRISPR-associated protein [Bacteroidia bacterium]
MINIEQQIFLKIISPVYIGGAQEKNLQEGLDFFENYRIIESELYHPEKGIDPDLLATALASGDNNALANLIKKQDDWKYRYVRTFMGEKGSTGEIKAFIKSGADGRPYIPGSSLKGAMRSAIANHLCGGHANDNPDPVFIKNFENSLFRYIKVTDCFFNEVRLYRSKIASLGNRGIRWKVARTKNEDNFNPNGFDTAFESPEIGSSSSFSLKIAQPFFQNFQRQLSGLHPYARNFLNQDNIIQHFLEAINQYTLNFVDKEIRWFENYKGDKSNQIIDQMRRIIAPANRGYLMRLGFGTGFHAMSGDWKFDNHIQVGTIERNKNKIPRYKTRRIAFDQWPNPSYFGPLGYVLLSLNPFEQSSLITQESSHETRMGDVKTLEVKPVHRDIILKPNKENLLDAEVKENNQVEVYMPDKTTRIVRLVSGKAEPGKVIEVAIYPDKKGNFNQASFNGYKK